MELAAMGATGNVGSELVALLAADGHAVRALSHSGKVLDGAPEGVSAFSVDLNDPESLGPALDGAEGAFMLSGYDDAGIVAALEGAGVQRVALLSSGAVPTAGPENAVAAYHRESEAELSGSGLAAAFLRPNSFMSNALRWVDAIRAGDPVEMPFASVPIACNDPRDVARVAAAVLVDGRAAGEALRITGPEALLPAEQVAILAEVLGVEIEFRAQSDAVARAEMEASMPAAYVDAFFELFVEGMTDETTVLPTVAEVTGQEPTRFREWAEEHAGAFR